MKPWESSTFLHSVLGLVAYIGGNALGVPVPWELVVGMTGAYALKEGVRYTAEGRVEAERLAAWRGNPMRSPGVGPGQVAEVPAGSVVVDAPVSPRVLELRAELERIGKELKAAEQERARRMFTGES